MSQIILTPPASPSSTFNVSQTTVRLSKPHALMFAKYPSVQVTRSRSDFFLPDGRLKPNLTKGLATSSVVDSSVTSAAAGDGRSETSTAPTEEEEEGIGAGTGGVHTVYLGIGTNMGERVGNISKALKELSKNAGGGGKTRVVDTSFLYESEAMYVKEQSSFLNGVVKVSKNL